MQIDWLTTAAQIVNFLILLWLLQRFLYKPLMRAIDAREAEIQRRLEDAANKAEAAEAERGALKAERDTLNAQREDALEAARREAADIRKTAHQAARDEIARERDAWRAGLDAERRAFAQDAAASAAHTLIDLARRAFKDLAGADAQKQAIDAFVGAIEVLGTAEKDALANAIARHGVRIETAAPPGRAGLQRLRKTLMELGGEDTEITVETRRALGLGARLTAGATVLDWSLEGYLDGFEEDVLEAMQNESGEAEPPERSSQAAE